MFDLAPRSLCRELCLLISIAASLANALEPSWPRQTHANEQFPAHELMGFTPKPTEAPRIRGRMANAELFPRQILNKNLLCGYISGNIERSITCDDIRSTCMINSAIKAVGCCSGGSFVSPQACNQWTACRNYIDVQSCNSASCTPDDLLIQCTNSALPSCYTYSWNLGDYKSVGCASTGFFRVAHFTYDGEVLDGASSTASTATSSSSPASTTVTHVPSGDSSSSNVGAIAGGSVGGLAVVAALVVALVYLRSKKKRDALAAAEDKKATHGIQTPATGYPPDGFYDVNGNFVKFHNDNPGGSIMMPPQELSAVERVELPSESMAQMLESPRGPSHLRHPSEDGDSVHALKSKRISSST